jgi:hypothetical protein
VPRSLTIFFPNRKTEYWFTASVFRPGDTVERNNKTWEVTSVSPPAGGADGVGKHTTITLRAVGDSPS